MWTHEDQGGVQIFVTFLEEVLVIFFGHLAVIIVKLGSVILLSRHCDLFWAVRGSQWYFCRAQTRLPVCLWSNNMFLVLILFPPFVKKMFPTLILFPPFFKILTATESQRVRSSGGHESYFDGEVWAGLWGLLGFRRFFDLRTES